MADRNAEVETSRQDLELKVIERLHLVAESETDVVSLLQILGAISSRNW